MMMEQNRFEIEADSLPLAREMAQAEIPDGFVLISENIIREGVEKTLTAVAKTEEAALSKLKRKCPRNARIVDEKVLVSSVQEEITVEGFDKESAKAEAISQAAGQYGDQVRMTNFKLAAKGKSGFLGIGKKPDQYSARLRRDATVEITYQTGAKIAVTFGTPDERLVAALENHKDDACDAAIDEIARLETAVLQEKWEIFLEPLLLAAWIDRSTSPDARERAAKVVQILREMGDPAEQRLTDMMENDIHYRWTLMACIALVRLGDPTLASIARAKIVKIINAADPYEALPAVEAMACTGDEYAVDYLANVVLKSHPNEQVRTQAAIRLGEIGDERAVPALIEAQEDPNSQNLQLYVRHALDQIAERGDGPS